MAENISKVPSKGETKIPVAREEGRQPFASLRREINRLFDDFMPMRWHTPVERPSLFDMDVGWQTSAPFQVLPAMDLVEKKGAYELTAEMPGMEEKDIEIRLSNGSLVIRGEKTFKKEESDEQHYMSERRYGSFLRSFQVPATVDASKIDATFSKGVLTVRMPKSEEAKKSEKKIEVKAA